MSTLKQVVSRLTPNGREIAAAKSTDEHGFTEAECQRMQKSLRTTRKKLQSYIKQLGLQGMTTKAAVKAIRDYRGDE